MSAELVADAMLVACEIAADPEVDGASEHFRSQMYKHSGTSWSSASTSDACRGYGGGRRTEAAPARVIPAEAERLNVAAVGLSWPG